MNERSLNGYQFLIRFITNNYIKQNTVMLVITSNTSSKHDKDTFRENIREQREKASRNAGTFMRK
jgi:hypothetical protein